MFIYAIRYIVDGQAERILRLMRWCFWGFGMGDGILYMGARKGE